MMGSAAQDRLGPPRVRLGSLFQMPQGKVIAVGLAVAVIAILVSFVAFVGIGIMFLEDLSVRLDGTGVALALLFTVPLLLFLLAALAFVVAATIEYRRTFVHVHESGLEIRQPWFTRRVIPWEEVTALEPSVRVGLGWGFFVQLANGERLMVTRLNIEPRARRVTTVSHHPDVEMVLEHYRQWCESQGREPNILI